MIEEAKQYLIDNEILLKTQHKIVNIHKVCLEEQLIELLVNFTRIQLQKQHDEALKILKDDKR